MLWDHFLIDFLVRWAHFAPFHVRLAKRRFYYESFAWRIFIFSLATHAFKDIHVKKGMFSFINDSVMISKLQLLKIIFFTKIFCTS